ncbi:nitrous oxide reductase accessory protein NosL [Brevibacillus daliensis]|uniref:nitrous oxide reductase accessory protein NosL n=1 Tax=Brevibacillus daliensis TaxID=2892995 RepID=UPI001E2A8E6E|nr:nitrous oxide reductase accessory protein NosL [Brevibacillus daliensis]
MKKHKGMLLTSLLLTMALVTGCGSKEVQPVAIQEGVDKCAVCNMQVSDDHNATQIITKDGKSLKFDDIGDLFVWTKEHGTENVEVQFVRDYHSKEWMYLDQATFAYDKDFKTPMSYGVYSFKDKESAEAFVKEQGKGKVMTQADLTSHSWERNKSEMHHSKDGMKSGHGDQGSSGHGDQGSSGH